jgi:hypothetical protein
MDQTNDRPKPEHSPPAEPPPAPRKRFRIEKIEERIAPNNGGRRSHNGSASGSDPLTTSTNSSLSY